MTPQPISFTNFGDFGTLGFGDSCWSVDSTYVANTPLLQFSQPVGVGFDTFTPSTQCDGSSGWGFSFGSSFNWGGWGGFSLPWQTKSSSSSKTSSAGAIRGGKNGLLGTAAWDAHMRGKIKTVKRCNEDYISELQPKMQEKVRKLEAFAKKKGIKFQISSGYRTPEKQQQLRNKYGSRRAASVDGSPHRSGRAIDISTNGILTEAQCKILGEYAESIGMRWGGRWGGPGSSTVRERWHFDLPA